MGDDRQPAPSRTLLEGPARAPARSYLRNKCANLTEQPGQRVVASADAVLAGLDDADDYQAGA